VAEDAFTARLTARVDKKTQARLHNTDILATMQYAIAAVCESCSFCGGVASTENASDASRAHTTPAGALRMRTRMYMRLCGYLCTKACVCTCVCVCVWYVYVYAHVCMCACACLNKTMHTRTCTHARAATSTHLNKTMHTRTAFVQMFAVKPTETHPAL
jgi:hypothetical protein